MSPFVIRVLRALLVLIALGALAAQIVIVVLVVIELGEPDAKILALLYGSLAVAALACFEVLLVALWVLLSMVRRGAIFEERAFGWVTVISIAGLAGAVLVAVLCAHAGEIDDAPGLVLIGGGIGVGGVAFALLMVVMRGLLRTATDFRRELDAVV